MTVSAAMPQNQVWPGERNSTMNFGGYGIWGVLVLIADIYAILNVLQSSDENLRKAVWIAVILVLPFLGAILWYFFGPRGPGLAR